MEAGKYTKNSRIQQIQAELTERALELLNLPDDTSGFVLDIGCGSGLSGEVLEEYGHYWVGCDISRAMLDVARGEREVDGDLLLHDIGAGFGFRPGTFDGVISISCIQWLCNADYKSQNPWRRLCRFFTTLYSAMRQGARAVFQFYPENANQIEMITSSAMQSGFGGGLVIDYPNSAKRKKYFLCLFAGGGQSNQDVDEGVPVLPRGLDESMDVDDEYDDGQVKFTSRSKKDRMAAARQNKRMKKIKTASKDIDWIMRKKETRRKRGQKVVNDSKFTGRKRRPKF